MKLKILHETRYHYDLPARNLIQSLRLTPSASDGQRAIEWKIEVTGGIRGPVFRDGAGDWIEGWTVRGPLDEIAVHCSGVVETTDLFGILRGHREVINPLAYLRGTGTTAPDAALTDLAKGGQGDGALNLAHDLSRRVQAAIAYRPGVTHARTTAAEALALGEGVCQDHAHALIAVARLRDLPARYVSGYLHSTIDGTPHEAAHAWAEIHIEGLGWIGFDAANGCCPDDRYVRLGSGLDAPDAAPIRGMRAGPGAEMLSVTVRVEEI
ncbi:MAG: transglutaminase family protein [Paracoccus sp. (in: a-proteobacteria)]|nr:transglutaminase family protein [Paracoccus sp. (in: a-proteobacteria)]